ncbi:hypothetical protein BT96DRAFT_822851 [Gymnopus androsaceus JB14]|uniref:Integrase core domain-containing protein n=1 Tax=Gymnopus androsaceus JB14 TaxID=1447944 RepID=A0A6A4HIK6_9AGAR|nr:hypothetical protein BT96DRAFT_822851 [Gymnopus androsaceus JB14]
MGNTSGANGHNNGTRPSDEKLSALLHDYACRNLSLSERLQYLEEKEGYKIGKSTLKKLNAKFKVPTVNKPPPLPVAATLVTKHVFQDIAAQNGPSTIVQNIWQEDGVFIPRDTVRSIMRDVFPHGAEMRFPGKKIPRVRGRLRVGDGVFQEVHCDGHEKLNSKALRMGPVSIDIYGMHCHSAGKLLHYVVVPNARCSSTVGHIYLDFVEKYGMTCEKLTVDGGSETGEMYACHQALHDKYLPNVQTPSFVALKSTDNIVIEGSWNHWLRYKGKTLREAIEVGRNEGYFQPSNEMHVLLFNWIWPKVVQSALDEFVAYWNNHKTRNQHAANIPTGAAPNVIFDFPHNYGLSNCGVAVPTSDIAALRETILRTREECFQWVPVDFDTTAYNTYVQLNSPKLDHTTGWQVFVDMIDSLT